MMTAASGGNRESLLGAAASKTQVLLEHEAMLVPQPGQWICEA